MLKKAVGDKLTESQIGDVWKMADIDGDNRLTREEVRAKRFWVSDSIRQLYLSWRFQTLQSVVGLSFLSTQAGTPLPSFILMP